MIDINLLLSFPGSWARMFNVESAEAVNFMSTLLLTFFHWIFQFSASGKLPPIYDEREVIAQNKGNKKRKFDRFLGISYQLETN